jgi:hypothetical protein
MVPPQRKERQKNLYKLRSLYSRRVWYIAFFADWCNSFRHKNNRYLYRGVYNCKNNNLNIAISTVFDII